MKREEKTLLLKHGKQEDWTHVSPAYSNINKKQERNYAFALRENWLQFIGLDV